MHGKPFDARIFRRAILAASRLDFNTIGEKSGGRDQVSGIRYQGSGIRKNVFTAENAKNTKKKRITRRRGAKRRRRIQTPHGFRDYARNDTDT
jgi:hypothetical protein